MEIVQQNGGKEERSNKGRLSLVARINYWLLCCYARSVRLLRCRVAKAAKSQRRLGSAKAKSE